MSGDSTKYEKIPLYQSPLLLSDRHDSSLRESSDISNVVLGSDGVTNSCCFRRCSHLSAPLQHVSAVSALRSEFLVASPVISPSSWRPSATQIQLLVL